MDPTKLLDGLGIDLSTLLSGKNLTSLISTLGILVLVLVAFAALGFALRRLLKARATAQTQMLIQKGVRYAAFIVAGLILFDRLGIDLTALFGAAGIAGIAVGFAAQTSISNVISGLFLVSEKPFAIGDVIEVGGATGTVRSVDLLSVKIQTFDNRFIRIPNETIIKSSVVNLTRYPIRRMDLTLTISWDDDLDEAIAALRKTARENLYVLDNPETLVLIDGFTDKGVTVLLGLWFLQSDFLDLRNSMMRGIRAAFRASGFHPPAGRLVVESKGKTKT